MNKTDLEELLDLTADTYEIGGPPTADLIAAGSSRRRRRQRVAAGAVSAATALVLGGAFALWPSNDGDNVARPAPTASTTSATDDRLITPAGMRFVGVAGVVVAVPLSWTSQDTICGSAQTNTVIFDDGSGMLACAGPQHDVSELYVSDGHAALVPTWTTRYDTTTEVDGVVVRTRHGAEEHSCPTGSPREVCRYPGGAISVPSFGVTFWMRTTDPSISSGIIDSLRVLPADYTTVPYLTLPMSVDEATAMLKQSGLVADLANGDANHDIHAIDPPPGTAVAVGSSVVLNTVDPAEAVAGIWRPTTVLGAPFGRPMQGLMQIGPGGHWMASDTCNDHFGGWRVVSQGVIAFIPRGSSLVGCNPPLAVIGVVTQARVDGDVLTLLDDHGTELITYTRITFER